MKPLIICADWFAPGIRAGGPIRSVVNLSVLLGDHAEIFVITSDRDHGATDSYPGVVSDVWTAWKDKAKVRYCSSAYRRMTSFAAILKSEDSAIVYLNSVFSFAGTLWPLLWIRFFAKRISVVLAPRGMLKPSALRQKNWKKRPLLKLIRFLGLTKNVVFHATSDDEVGEIKDAFGAVQICQIANVPTIPAPELPVRQYDEGTAHLCFVGRVHPIKNLLWLLESMQRVEVSCRLIVVGPIEDQAYYEQCQAAVAALPDNVSVEFVGPQTESEVCQRLIQADAMVMPTLGENFGHAIFESFAFGTPVIVSDRTIWRNLQSQNAGWDLSLDSSESFVQAISTLAKMSAKQHQQYREGAMHLAHQFVSQNDFEGEYKRLFWGDCSAATSN